jgi:hypothetical protein
MFSLGGLLMTKKKLFIILGSVGGAVLLFCCGGILLFLALYRPYGTKIDLKAGSQLYYTSTVTEPEAQKLAQFLNETFLKDETPPITFQLNKEGQTYQVRVVIKEGKEKEAELPFLALGHLMALQVFEKVPLEVHLCDQNLKTVKVIEIKQSQGNDKGTGSK